LLLLLLLLTHEFKSDIRDDDQNGPQRSQPPENTGTLYLGVDSVGHVKMTTNFHRKQIPRIIENYLYTLFSGFEECI
jgi:hypothetical protein